MTSPPPKGSASNRRRRDQAKGIEVVEQPEILDMNPPPVVLTNGRLDRSVKIATLLSLLVTGFSAGWAVVEYSSQAEAERAEKTLAYIAKWEDDKYQASYRLLDDNWTKFLSSVPEDQRDIADRDSASKARLINRYYRDNQTVEGWPAAVADTTYFFNHLGLCVQSGICSKKVANAFFGDIVDSYLSVFGTYLEQNSDKLSGNIDVIRSAFH